jgi:hypothetical protein
MGKRLLVLLLMLTGDYTHFLAVRRINDDAEA